MPSGQSDLLRVEPGAPGMSYNQGKIKGIHLDPPFNGSGKRMPWFPPQPSEDEVALIDEWIIEGALDN